MKIVVFGTTDDVDRQVVFDAMSRHQQFFAIGRSDVKLARLPEGEMTIRADLDGDTQFLSNLVSDNELAISALRPNDGQESALFSVTRIVLSSASEAGVPINIAGAAAALKLADGSGHTVLTAPGFLPEAVRSIADACAAQNALLESESVAERKCLRPPAMHLDDSRTNQYGSDTDTLITDDAGLSQISYTDFAAAMLNVAENRKNWLNCPPSPGQLLLHRSAQRPIH